MQGGIGALQMLGILAGKIIVEHSRKIGQQSRQPANPQDHCENGKGMGKSRRGGRLQAQPGDLICEQQQRRQGS